MVRIVALPLSKADKGLTPSLDLIRLLLVEEVCDIPLRRRTGGILKPRLFGLRILCREDLHLVTILQLGRDVDHLMIHLSPDAAPSQFRIELVGKVEHSEVLWTAYPIPLAGEDEHVLIGKLVHHRLVVV